MKATGAGDILRPILIRSAFSRRLFILNWSSKAKPPRRRENSTAARLAPNSCTLTIPNAAAGLPSGWNATRRSPIAAFILERLIRAELFEQVLQARYLGSKRFSLEGVTAVIPLLDRVLSAAAAAGAEQVVLGMSHRGRLNVMAHIAGQRAADIFAGFEDVDPRSVLGSGDVKYHVGATGEYRTREGRKLSVHLASNPSHLEAVDPVVVGRARAKQTRAGNPGGVKKILPIVLHGDAAFAGQGVWAETLNLADIEAYSVGGTIHVIVNNLLGFTTEPRELQSSRFASSLAKRQAVPIFHVNGEDPDAVVRVGQIALEYRSAFGSDVVID